MTRILLRSALRLRCGPRAPRRAAALVAALALAALLAAGPALGPAGTRPARAQSPTATATPAPDATAGATPGATGTSVPTGHITGTVTQGTAGASLPGSLSVLLVSLDGNTVTGSQQTAVTDGHYAFAVPADPSVSYVLRIEYEGVPYFANAVQLTPAQPAARRDLTIYETTSTAPALTIQSTIVTLVAIDRASGTLTLLREDLVRNPTDRVYVGANGAPTLRLPAPDGTTDATGLTSSDPVKLNGEVVTVGTPLLPGVTSVVTRYTVGYDRQTDRYRLRVTTPLQADHIEARAPARFIRAMDPVGDAQRAPDTQVQGEQLLVVARDNAPPGQGLLVDLVGLSGTQPATNPLTDQPTVEIGALVALLVIVGGVVGSAWLRDRLRAAP